MKTDNMTGLAGRDAATLLRRRNWRMFKDKFARYGVAIGGLSVIISIVLIFFYLLMVVLPLFESASVTPIAQYHLAVDGAGSNDQTILLAMDEQAEMGVRFSSNGQIVFFNTTSGEVVARHSAALPDGVDISSFAVANKELGLVAYGLSDGSALVLRHVYQVSYPDDVRTITPNILYPYGETPLVIDDDGAAIRKMAFKDDDEQASFVALTTDDRLILSNFVKEDSMFDDDVSFEREQVEISDDSDGQFLLINAEQTDVYVANAIGQLDHYDIIDKFSPTIVQRQKLVGVGETLSSLQFLTGDISLLVGDSAGRITQWFAVRDDHNNMMLTRIRDFSLGHGAIQAISAEYTRKGFIVADDVGHISVFHTTAERQLLEARLPSKSLVDIVLSPRADAFIAEDKTGQLYFWEIDNEYPEVSWSVLWEKVWYESYTEPDYIWQSSSASDDFEPKLSLVPLVFGTLKAALYTMLLAIPLAIMGAIYTAYFMAPRLRSVVKPSIEVMEALPTVILGFLAGLWLAPFLESHLATVFCLFLIMPLGILSFAFAWQNLPGAIRHRVPEGWDAALLIPVILLLGWVSVELNTPLEQLFFGGDMLNWVTNDLGIGFDQRNALVVGIAMGFAVIPTIFSIAEDAIFSVPKHLSYGSLALGATQWQTLVRVILLTASPGIFSAVMIGSGRAVGETMIVLMATGNTPLMDANIFEGMRTLSANIAVEMPESELGSTHYRVLFLAALVLFVFTFLFNTVAELVRQRLRLKYSSL